MHKKQYDEATMVAKSDDQFFTHPLVAQRCWNTLKTIDISGFESIIEPSAGDGSFLDLLPKEKRVGVDLVKQHSEVIESDFFKWYPDNYSPLFIDSKSNNMIVGNPPFGKNSNLAIRFFNHGAVFADTIAFVIPRTWRKWSVQHKLDNRFGLYLDATLPFQSFYVDDKPWHRIRCCFQVWSKRELEFADQTPDWSEMDLRWSEFNELKAKK